MALLVGIQRMNGEWDNFVLTHYPAGSRLSGNADVLGRILPRFRYVAVYDGLARQEAIRLANQLRGLPRAKRRDAFLRHSSGLELRAYGGLMR